ncbi:hypothetical protein QEJ31_08140 [Pigmentibacter sp. JX0631]|uniref:hypothetical protein n=1 Tax=Pigmentibacter sp. JX0631 TaxID=2976982 RepID=UPI0024685533|nr:hypothetical protein [Pigmentibacter sp. JX0631]WGL58509.1 hypothetical protein QEJ31_08140 [Pigmentibacter sp. JX0631]
MSIAINIIAGVNAALSSIITSGNEAHVITKNEEKSFHIGDKDILKKMVELELGKKPFAAYLHGPTSFGNLYTKNAWQEVETHLTVRNASITKFESRPFLVETKYFANLSKIKAQFNASISANVTNTIESNWSHTNTISFDQAFNYGIQFNGAGLGGNTNLHYEHSWGKGGSKTESFTIGSSSGLLVDLEPGQNVIAELLASKGTIYAKIEYETHLEGDIATNYFLKLNGSHYWAVPIMRAMKNYGLENSKKTEEIITVDFYSNSSVILKDTSGTLLKQFFLDKQGNVLSTIDFLKNKTF